MASILDSPSAQRNKEPIWNVLSEKVLPLLESRTSTDNGDKQSLRVLEIAAGCGVHTEYFANRLSNTYDESITSVRYFPSDPDGSSRASIQARIEASKLDPVVVDPPLALTLNANGIVEKDMAWALDEQRQQEALDLIICINMIHISPWDATRGLMKVAGQLLREGGILFCYGPYKVGGTAVESNLRFDQSLRSRNPSWGVRDLEQVVKEAEECGLSLCDRIDMPANNLSVLFRKE